MISADKSECVAKFRFVSVLKVFLNLVISLKYVLRHELSELRLSRHDLIGKSSTVFLIVFHDSSYSFLSTKALSHLIVILKRFFRIFEQLPHFPKRSESWFPFLEVGGASTSKKGEEETTKSRRRKTSATKRLFRLFSYPMF